VRGVDVPRRNVNVDVHLAEPNVRVLPTYQDETRGPKARHDDV
jgi:hypothetical protein